MSYMSRMLAATLMGLAAGVANLTGAAKNALKAPGPHLPQPTRSRSKSAWGEGKRGYMLNGRRVFYRPAAPWVKSAQNGLHWENGKLVPPARSKKR